MASEDWLTVNEVADVAVRVLGLKRIEYIHKPVLHGVGWMGDVKRIALDISILKSLGFKPGIRAERQLNLQQGPQPMSLGLLQ